MQESISSNKNVIEFHKVSKSYDDKYVLKDLDLFIASGEFIAVLGESGGGKTTLLRLINRLIEPEEGTIKVEGKDISKVDPISLRRNIGYIIQQTGLFPHMTVKENIVYVLSLEKKSEKEKNDRAEELINMMGLDSSYLTRYPGELSGGEAQRIGVARGLANEPEIVLMDEPFAAVDDINRRKLQRQVKNIHRKLKKTIVFVTHDIREAFYLGTRVAIFNNGQLVQVGSPEELLVNPKNTYIKEFLGVNGYMAFLSDEEIIKSYQEKIKK